VLLKNDGGALPLKSADLEAVVLIGPTAAQVDAIGINGERSLGLTDRQVSPLDALQRRAHVHVRFAVDDDMTGTPIPSSALRPANPNTIVVLNTSQPVALPWVNKVRAILEMWWPGDEGGWATADVLLGKRNPAGRLPMTWARRLQDYPATDPRYPERSAAGIRQKTTYSEGVDIGYRWFDREHLEPLFAFGHGLTYTRFAYSALEVARTPDGGLNVSVRIENTGTVDGDEVPQVYLGAPAQVPERVQFPPRSLVAFDRINIAAGKTRTVTLHVPLRRLQYWSTHEDSWITAPGTRSVSVGASSRDLRLTQVIE